MFPRKPSNFQADTTDTIVDLLFKQVAGSVPNLVYQVPQNG
jgi:hypothetical protein